jgi:hypothetical protein
MPVINVFGPSGSGKTFYIRQKKPIEIDYEILKTREDTIDFMDRVRLPVLVDNYESVASCIGIKELRGNVYIVSETKLDLDIIQEYLEVPRPTPEVLSVALRRPVTLEESLGNLHLLFNGTFDARDVFRDPFTYVESLFHKDYRFDLDRILSEHGHVFGIVHENCVSENPELSESLSLADILDSYIYSETSWEVGPFFHAAACLKPAFIMRPMKFEKMRTGSMWTKFSNMCMKKSRLKKLGIPLEHISLLVQKANAGDPLQEFTDPYDLDTINQLSLSVKIKPKILNQLKKVRRQNQTPPRQAK